MPTKTIPELTEIDLADVEDTHLFVLETGLETFKLRFSTLIAFARSLARTYVEVELAGSETGVQTIDVSSYEIDATKMIWTFKKPTTGEQFPGPLIKTPDADTVTIDLGEFTAAAGTYLLLGV